MDLSEVPFVLMASTTTLATFPLPRSMALSGVTGDPAGKDLIELVQELLVFSRKLRVGVAQDGMGSCTPIKLVEELLDFRRRLRLGAEQVLVDLLSHQKAALRKFGVATSALLGLGAIFWSNFLILVLFKGFLRSCLATAVVHVTAALVCRCRYYAISDIFRMSRPRRTLTSATLL
jgi:hypothetical protein